MSGTGNKAELRARAGGAVGELDDAEMARESEAVSRAIVSLCGSLNTRVVMGYIASGREIDVGGALRELLDLGVRVAIPRVDWATKRMRPLAVGDLEDDIEVRRHGVGEPRDRCAGVALTDVQIVVVPGVAFDRDRNRLGRGGGFYDRFLSEWRAAHGGHGVACGVCFRSQVVERIPTEPHDAALDVLVTADGIIGRS